MTLQRGAHQLSRDHPDPTHPVEIRDRAQLVAWAAQRLGRSVAVPDLALSGYRFMGGRIVATAHGPAALLMYDNDHGLRLVMLMRPMAREQNMPMARYAEGALNGYSWAAKGLGYSLSVSRRPLCCIPSPTKYAGKSRAPSDSSLGSLH
jgi:anti-sigma factor RsiW